MIDERWDVIVVGTGMGGATLGAALAAAGKRVLFCEQGRSQRDGDDFRGGFAEESFPRPAAPGVEHAELLTRAGRWWEEVDDRSGRRPRRYIPVLGAGVGGSSALYGAALERFYPQDFTPRRNFPDNDGADLPETWPIGYADLRPYYHRAELMYGVRGGVDPLRAAQLDPLPELPPMTGASRELFDTLSARGLHPYRLPTAIAQVPGCLGCQAFLCPNGCKHDAGSVCIAPALDLHGAHLLDECRVVGLTATRTRVTGVTCVRRGDSFTLRGDVVVLAAGALRTPCLLLRSASADWPHGLANRSGLVGRNLMRHFMDLYAVFVDNRDGLSSGLKEVAFNDHYLTDWGKAGTVQSFGTMPSAPVLAALLEKDVPWPWLAPAVRLAAPLLRRAVGYPLTRSLLLASVMEDLPHRDNRVMPADDGDRVALVYRPRPSDIDRLRRWRRQLTGVLGSRRVLLLKQADKNERMAHACGTCRFGTDPRTSVLDPDNRAHGLANLYIVDSSFFPSSGGINPALTIAANALRVADRMLGR